MSAGEQSNDSSKLSLTTNNGSSTFATVVKELATNINYLSLNNEPPTTNEQAEAVHKVWLSKSERITIENSWNRATKSNAREQVGIQLFGRILSARPEMKHLFGLQKIPEGRLKYDPRFRRHAIVFTKSFDYIVKNIAYKEKLEQHFQALGERHTTLQGRGFNPEYWDTFNDCMRQTVSLWGKDKNHKTENTWHMLVSFVLQNMKIGFDRANSRHPRRARHVRRITIPSAQLDPAHGQKIDPIQFYKQFCLQQKESKQRSPQPPVD